MDHSVSSVLAKSQIGSPLSNIMLKLLLNTSHVLFLSAEWSVLYDKVQSQELVMIWNVPMKIFIFSPLSLYIDQMPNNEIMKCREE